MSGPNAPPGADDIRNILLSVKEHQRKISESCAAMDEMAARSREAIAESYKLLARANGTHGTAIEAVTGCLNIKIMNSELALPRASNDIAPPFGGAYLSPSSAKGFVP